MQTEAEWVAAIQAEPNRDDLRMQFADWLTHRGDLRGELVRLQCQWARKRASGETDTALGELQTRSEALLEAHGATWRANLPAVAGVTWGEPYRGLIRNLTILDVDAFLESAIELFRVECIDSLTIHNIDPRSMARLAQCPFLSRLSRLDFTGNEMGAAGIHPLLSSPYLLRLEELILRDNDLGLPGVQVLASAPQLARLNVLDLQENELGDTGLHALSISPYLSQLRELNLANNLLGSIAIDSFAQSENYRCLNYLSFQQNLIGDDGGRLLARLGERLTQLTHLNLSSTGMGPDGMAYLAAAPQFRQLATLNLANNRLLAAGVKSLTHSSQLNRLRHLDLASNRIGDEGAETLAEVPGDRTLETLNLDSNGIGRAGGLALSRSPVLNHLTLLSVRNNPLGPKVLVKLQGRFGEALQHDPFELTEE